MNAITLDSCHLPLLTAAKASGDDDVCDILARTQARGLRAPISDARQPARSTRSDPVRLGNVIFRRVVYDPRRESNGADRSLRAWLRAASSGLCDIDPVVLPMQAIDKHHVEPYELEGALGDRLRDKGWTRPCW